MTRMASLDLFTRKGADEAARVAAAAEVGRQLATERPLDVCWQAVCAVAMDQDDAVEVRRAAIRALANAAAAAPNQLVRSFPNDPTRALRKEALEVMRGLGVAPVMTARLEEQLTAARGPGRVLALANLALTFGYAPRIVAIYRECAADADEKVRLMCINGLSMLGEMDLVRDAMKDPVAPVRAHAAEMLGHYSTLLDLDIRALGAGLTDVDPAVQKAARTALKRLGIQPMAAPPAKKRLQKETGRFAWKQLLLDWSHAALADADYAVTLDDAVVQSGWLGFPGATAPQLKELATRLGRPLPPSYAEFLAVTNGFRRITPSIDEAFPAAQVQLFSQHNADWIAAWKQHALPVKSKQHLCYGTQQDCAVFDASYLDGAVQVSAVGDGVLLLNPAVTTPDGEWEAWFFASWLPGARRYPSFWDLVTAEAVLTT